MVECNSLNFNPSKFFELEASEESEEEALERQIKEVRADIKKAKAKKQAITSKKKLLKRLEKELKLAQTGLSGESSTSSEAEMVIVSDEDGPKRVKDRKPASSKEVRETIPIDVGVDKGVQASVVKRNKTTQTPLLVLQKGEHDASEAYRMPLSDFKKVHADRVHIRTLKHPKCQVSNNAKTHQEEKSAQRYGGAHRQEG